VQAGLVDNPSLQEIDEGLALRGLFAASTEAERLGHERENDCRPPRKFEHVDPELVNFYARAIRLVLLADQGAKLAV
jgi:hypothetical protein